MAFHALIRSKLDYAAPAWQSWFSTTNLSCLDRLYNSSLQLITGQLVSSPLEALCFGSCCSELPHIQQTFNSKKALRNTDDHPKCVALAADISQRPQNHSSFCWKAEERYTHLPPELQHRQNIHFLSPPWQLSTCHERRIATIVSGITGRADDLDQKRWCSLFTISSHYTDGSVSRGKKGCAAAVVIRRSPL